MAARDEFAVNDRVVLSDYGRSQFRDKDMRGIVRGFGRESHRIRVQVDGRSTTVTYAAMFWVKEENCHE